MATQSKSDAVRRFEDAWECGDDTAINRITSEINQSGNDANISAIVRIMAATLQGGGQ
ncbi:hypothetical protein ACFU76_04590 [Streptomyces sp. NPDC057539]|uniref:hypothetical protein n=1 Tax=Streptomyces sp. NPDC057539 TaxID=3346159 RepID=UPI0036D05345